MKLYILFVFFISFLIILGTYLGQNFLVDSKIKQYLASHILKMYQHLGCEALIEIGPGKGALTKLIHQISQHFFVVEKDEKMQEYLLFYFLEKGFSPPYFIWQDVLDVDMINILENKKLSPQKTLIVGNLPYYITSPILRKFFGHGGQNFAGGVFMVQNEVALRLDSSSKKKSYLRWLLNYAYDVHYLKGVPAKCFVPSPKVKSALIQLLPKNKNLAVDFGLLQKFLDLYSPFTRKTLGAISTMLAKKGQCNFDIPESLKKKRLEELTWNEMSLILM